MRWLLLPFAIVQVLIALATGIFGIAMVANANNPEVALMIAMPFFTVSAICIAGGSTSWGLFVIASQKAAEAQRQVAPGGGHG